MRYSSVLISFLITFLFSSCIHSQKLKPSTFGIKSKKALEFYLEGGQNEKWRDYTKAIQKYKEAIEIEPEFAEAHSRVMVLYGLQEKYDEGFPYMLKTKELIAEPRGIEIFNFGQYYFSKTNYQEAEEYYRKFLELELPMKPNLIQLAVKNLRNANFAKEAINNPIEFHPKNLGSRINSEGHEYMPYLTADESRLFITARRRESTGGFNAEYRDFTEDFFYSVKEGDDWKMVKNLGPPVNTELNEGAASFSPDGQLVFFTACNRKDGLGSCDIYMSKLKGDKWSEPENLGSKINSRFWDSQPCISNDGKTLFFVSARPGGVGKNDIWYSTKTQKGWSDCMVLKGPINTEGNENAPFLHADGKTMYFASDEHPGFGGFDLFISRSENGKWSKPKNMGYPLNTNFNEKTIFINTKGNLGFINSDQDGGIGGIDIYQFELDESLKPDFASFVKGKVFNVENKDPLEAKVLLLDVQSGDTIREVISNSSSGEFLVSLPEGRNYAAFVKKKGFLFYSGSFEMAELNDENRSFTLEIPLQPIKEGAKVVLENIFYESGKYILMGNSKAELSQLLVFLKKNPTLSIQISGHTDNVGSSEFNKELSKNRANSVRDFLLEKGVEGQRITAIGYGESEPIATNESEEGRASNRRTEFKITGL